MKLPRLLPEPSPFLAEKDSQIEAIRIFVYRKALQIALVFSALGALSEAINVVRSRTTHAHLGYIEKLYANSQTLSYPSTDQSTTELSMMRSKGGDLHNDTSYEAIQPIIQHMCADLMTVLCIDSLDTYQYQEVLAKPLERAFLYRWIRLGKPAIRPGTESIAARHFATGINNPFSNTIYSNDSTFYGIIAELSHSVQYKGDGLLLSLIYFLNDVLYCLTHGQTVYGDGAQKTLNYKNRTSREYHAHEKIEPALLKDIFSRELFMQAKPLLLNYASPLMLQNIGDSYLMNTPFGQTLFGDKEIDEEVNRNCFMEKKLPIGKTG